MASSIVVGPCTHQQGHRFSVSAHVRMQLWQKWWPQASRLPSTAMSSRQIAHSSASGVPSSFSPALFRPLPGSSSSPPPAGRLRNDDDDEAAAVSLIVGARPPPAAARVACLLPVCVGWASLVSQSWVPQNSIGILTPHAQTSSDPGGGHVTSETHVTATEAPSGECRKRCRDTGISRLNLSGSAVLKVRHIGPHYQAGGRLHCTWVRSSSFSDRSRPIESRAA